jgi:hypothetical protein
MILSIIETDQEEQLEIKNLLSLIDHKMNSEKSTEYTSATKESNKLFALMQEDRFLNKIVCKRLMNEWVAKLEVFEVTDNWKRLYIPSLQLYFRDLAWTNEENWIKFRFYEKIKLFWDLHKSYNKKWTVMKDKYLFLEFNLSKPTLILEWEIDFMSLHDDVFTKYNVIAYSWISHLESLLLYLLKNTRTNILYIWDNDFPAHKSFYNALNSVFLEKKIWLQRIYSAVWCLWIHKDINELVVNMWMPLWLDYIEKYIVPLSWMITDHNILSVIFPNLKHYLPIVTKTNILDLIKLAEVLTELWDRLIVVNEIVITYSKDWVLSKDFKCVIIHLWDEKRKDNISFSNSDMVDLNHYRRKLATIKFIDPLVDKKQLDTQMSKLKILFDFLEDSELVNIKKNYPYLWRDDSGNFLFSNGQLNVDDSSFTTFLCASYINKNLEVLFPIDSVNTDISNLDFYLSKYISSDYLTFVCAGYVYATIYLPEIRSFINSFPLLNIVWIRWCGKSYFLKVISSIVWYVNQNTIVNMVVCSESWLKNSLTSIKHVVFLDEYASKKFSYTDNTDGFLMWCYDGYDIIQWTVNTYWTATKWLPNQSAIIYGGMRTTESEALLTRSIVCEFDKNSTHKCNQKTIDEIIQNCRSAYFWEMMEKSQMNLPEIFLNLKTFLCNNNIDFDWEGRIMNNFIIISLYWRIIDKKDLIIKYAKLFSEVSTNTLETHSNASAVINHISSNIELYCSMKKHFSESVMPAIFIRKDGNLVVNIREIITIYNRHHQKQNSEIFKDELYHYFWWLWSMKKSYKETIFPNGKRKSNSVIQQSQITNWDVLELYNILKEHIEINSNNGYGNQTWQPEHDQTL